MRRIAANAARIPPRWPPTVSATRILPALLTASGVTLLAAGLLTYTTPVAAETRPVGQRPTDGHAPRRPRRP